MKKLERQPVRTEQQCVAKVPHQTAHVIHLWLLSATGTRQGGNNSLTLDIRNNPIRSDALPGLPEPAVQSSCEDEGAFWWNVASRYSER